MNKEPPVVVSAGNQPVTAGAGTATGDHSSSYGSAGGGSATGAPPNDPARHGGDATAKNARTAPVRAPRAPIFALYERMIGFRYLRSSNDGFVSAITLISLLGIVLGVATLIVVLAVLNGFRHEVRDKILGVNGHVEVRGTAGKVLEPKELAADISAMDGVKSVQVYAESTVLFSSPYNARGGLLRGVSRESLAEAPIISELIKPEQLDVLDERGSVLLGQTLANLLGVQAGDAVDVVVPNGFKGPFGSMPRLRAFKVGGTFNVGFSEFDSALTFMNIKDAQELLGLGEAASALEVNLEDPDTAPVFARTLESIYPEQVRYARSWQSRNSTFFNALKTERNVMFLVLMLIILIAALNVVSGMVMLVKEKKREIAVLRSIGAPRMAIARIFFISGGVVAIGGTIGGLGLGLLICARIEDIQRWVEQITESTVFSSEVYYLSQLPALVDPAETTVVVVSTLVLTVVTGLFPAIRAARMDPVEALRDG